MRQCFLQCREEHLELRALFPPWPACLFTPALEIVIKLSEEASARVRKHVVVYLSQRAFNCLRSLFWHRRRGQESIARCLADWPVQQLQLPGLLRHRITTAGCTLPCWLVCRTSSIRAQATTFSCWSSAQETLLIVITHNMLPNTWTNAIYCQQTYLRGISFGNLLQYQACPH